MWKYLGLTALAVCGLVGAGLLVAHFGTGQPESDRFPPTLAAASPKQDAKTLEMVSAPGLEDREYAAPLADALRRLDPAEDGWQTEAFYESVSRYLSDFGHALEQPNAHPSTGLKEFIADDFVTVAWQPSPLNEVFRDPTLTVRRAASDSGTTNGLRGIASFDHEARRFAERFADGRVDHVKLKLFKIDRQASHVATKVIFQASGTTGSGTLEMNAMWNVDWTEGARPQIERIAIESFEESLFRDGGEFMFADCTRSVMGDTDAYRNQFVYPTDYWRSRIARDLGLDVVANHGLALGDVNGDLLEDIYICQQGGLPNRLLVQNADGTLRDVSHQSGADWLDYCAAALLVDLDNDGDRDLVVAQEFAIVFMSNDGTGRFQVEDYTERDAQTYSLAAADYDLDSDLDVYCCGYNPAGSDLRRGAMGEPVPFHDAINGGRNVLLQNDGDWRFTDVTQSVGLDQNNTRFSFAATWEDYDNDGDLDLYVANDYGRNNLYRQDGVAKKPAGRIENPKFTDVAAELGVEDISSGMSVAWGDYNRDGWMDLYVSNMFSAAGNRITYQRQFKANTSETVRQQFQRLAHGNTLFRNTGDGGFSDVTDEADVWLGRWAWGSRFTDLNGDGWDDIVVANGFITTEDTGDL
jgi:hypothetical protein